MAKFTSEFTVEQCLRSQQTLLPILQRFVARRLNASQSLTIPIQRTWQSFGQGQPPQPVAAARSTLELFERDDIKGRLLILGEPGSGKTTELLLLAQALLQPVSPSKPDRIPAIFELFTWTPKQSISEWLCAQLERDYSVTPAIAQRWIASQQLLPLLDGLDELDVPHQKQCIAAIEQFLVEHPSLQTAICYRPQASEQETVPLQGINGAIALHPIADEQIQTYLQSCNRSQLWPRLQSDPQFMAFARSPLFLTMLVTIDREQTIQTVSELLHAHIETQLHNPNCQGAYPPGKAPSPAQTRRYLSWLAAKLNAQHEAEFWIERLPPTWLDSPKERRHYRLLVALTIWLLFALLLVPFVGLLVAFTEGIKIGLLSGLMYGSGYGLMFGWIAQSEDSIYLVKKRHWSWQQCTVVGLLTGLFLALVIGLLLGWHEAWISGLVFGLMFGLLLGLMGPETEICEQETPNQSIHLSLRNGLSFIFMAGLLGSLGLGLSFGPTVGLLSGVLLWLLGIVLNGRIAVQHSVLRFLLDRRGYAPWDYARFLDHAAQHQFIQRIGGRYRFTHDLLRQHFAAMHDVTRR